MTDNFKSAERPENKNASGWIEYAVLKFWRDCLSRDEYIAEWADDELATLRAQLAEAREIISEAKIEVGFAICGDTQPSTSVYDKLTAYLQKVKSA